MQALLSPFILHIPLGCFLKSIFLRLGTAFIRPTGNICDYSPHRHELLLLILAVDISYDVSCHSGNTLRFPRVTREPPRTIVLWCLTLATIPAGQGKLL